MTGDKGYFCYLFTPKHQKDGYGNISHDDSPNHTEGDVEFSSEHVRTGF